MKKNDDIKLDVTSNIDEKIIDEVTDKKISLLQKLGGTTKNLRKRFIAIGSIAASLALFFGIFFVLIVPLMSSKVPVYQGMAIRTESAASVSTDRESANLSLLSASYGKPAKLVPLSKSNGTPNGAANGHHKEDDDQLQNKIDDLVTIDVMADDEVRYYVKPGETFIIEVHIANPDNFEIQSFTLNGQKYANYMFKEGSTMELLLLEVTAPATPGYVEYTIDAIKYIDGTEIKDVDMSSGDKSVKAGIAYPEAPSASVTAQSILPTSIALSVNVTDPYSLIGGNELAIYLSDGEKIVDTKPLAAGENTVVFNNLFISTTYEYGIVTAFDLVDGRNLHEEWLLTGVFTTGEAFGIEGIKPAKDSVSFELEDLGAGVTVTSVSLYDDETDELVEMGDAETRTFTGLLSAHKYRLYVDFTYTIEGETVEDWVMVSIETVTKKVPKITMTDTSADQTSISYTIDVTDPDGILQITRVELVKDDEIVQENGTLLTGNFENLLSNNAYTVTVTYTYDLGDGQGTVTTSVSAPFKTKAKALPSVSIVGRRSIDTTIQGTCRINDKDSVGEITAVEIYKGDTPVQNNASKEIFFTDLEFYTDYQIRVTYTYDLNDGVGAQTLVATADQKTAPHFEVQNCKIANPGAISEGDTIYMQVNFRGTAGVKPTGIVINGQLYNCAAASTSSVALLEIVNEGQFDGGDTVLTVEQFQTEINKTKYITTVGTNNTADVFINSKLEVLGIEVVVKEGDSFEPRDYVFKNEEVYLLISLFNKTGYTIDRIVLDGQGECSDLIQIDQEHYAVKLTRFGGYQNSQYGFRERITEITYHNEHINNTLSVDVAAQKRTLLLRTGIKEIRTAEDLLNMNEGYYYVLQNDIDLSGMNWTGNELQGVFDGNGYSIQNMSFIGGAENRNIFGLFRNGCGIIQNLTLESVFFMIDSDIPCYVGGFAGTGSFSFINCTVDEKSIISTSHGVAGGFIGFIAPISFGGTFTDCTNNATVNGDIAGGICGTPIAGESVVMFFTQCTNNGDVNGAIAGGLIGLPLLSKLTRIRNCINNGSVTGRDHMDLLLSMYNDGILMWQDIYFMQEANKGKCVGGLVGIVWNGTIELIDCLNTGNTIGGLVGLLMYDDSIDAPIHTFTGCINAGTTEKPYYAALSNQSKEEVKMESCYSMGTDVTVAELNSKAFYTDTLGWDETIWNLDDLDMENGKYPTLK